MNQPSLARHQQGYVSKMLLAATVCSLVEKMAELSLENFIQSIDMKLYTNTFSYGVISFW